MPEDGYPTDEELEKIRLWSCIKVKDRLDLFEFIKSCWWSADWGWSEPNEKGLSNISTGGWSGNEDLINAMQDNSMFWAVTWQESRRGGHYVFKV